MKTKHFYVVTSNEGFLSVHKSLEHLLIGLNLFDKFMPEHEYQLKDKDLRYAYGELVRFKNYLCEYVVTKTELLP